jgi:hypothetical protein
VLLSDRAQGQHVATAGVGEQGIDLGVALLHGVVEAVDVGQLRHVGLHAHRVAADRLDGRVQLGLAAAGDEHARALGRERLSGGQADAAGAAGHHHHLVVELVAHLKSPWLAWRNRSPWTKRCIWNDLVGSQVMWH